MQKAAIKLFKRLLEIVLGPAFGSGELELGVLIKSFLIQKIFRINAHVPWPVHPTTVVKGADKILRGTRFPGLSPGCNLDGRNGIDIGKNVWIGPGVSLISMNHSPNNFFEYVKCDPIKIGDNCWLGSNATLLPAVSIGDHTIVAAGAVVTKSFLDGNQVLAGVPAKVIKLLGDYEGPQNMDGKYS